MSKQTTTRHRYTNLVHALYAVAVFLVLVWAVLPEGRWASLAFALCSSLPLVAYVVDVIHTNQEESK